jgi:3-deoxy-7-phosphoheptulonate synthase
MPPHAQLDDLNIVDTDVVPPPDAMCRRIPVPDPAARTVEGGRKAIQNILRGTDERMFFVVGPCSVHDPEAALDYARRLKQLADSLADELLIVMRVYFEKPRTTVGWKGLINDPAMDDSFQISRGIEIGRQLLVDINAIGLPAGTEALDPTMPQYLGDLVAWNAIGARTTESQTHREMASGLSTPVGFKNATDGDLDVAVNAMLSASRPHAFLGVDRHGRVAVIRTRGNGYGHLILRGGNTPNFDSVAVAQARAALHKASLPENIVIDCSHGNSKKDPSLQPLVLRDVIGQVVDGNRAIKGVMLESNLFEGAQKLNGGPLRYGVSVTDACIGWETTEQCLVEAAKALRARSRG